MFLYRKSEPKNFIIREFNLLFYLKFNIYIGNLVLQYLLIRTKKKNINGVYKNG